MKAIKRIVIRGSLLLLLAGGIAMVAMKQSAIANLRAEHQTLLDNSREAQQLAKENGEISSLRQQADEAEKLRAENQDLPRLRNEVGQLRKQTADLDKLRADHERLLAKISAGQSSQSTAPALPADYISRDALRDMGLSSPENTMQTLFWAMSTGNMKRLMQCSANDQNLTRSDSELEAQGQDLAKQFTAFPGYRVAEKTNLAPDEVQLGIQASPGGVVAPIKFKLDGSQWKLEQ
jgi:DNA repair exonuclease SbcCD ATPase subunit